MGATEEEDEEGALLEAAEASSNVTDGEEEEVGSRPFDYNLWVAPSLRCSYVAEGCFHEGHEVCCYEDSDEEDAAPCLTVRWSIYPLRLA